MLPDRAPQGRDLAGAGRRRRRPDARPGGRPARARTVGSDGAPLGRRRAADGVHRRVVPQLPLSFANSCLATADAARTYFGERAARIRPGRLATSLGSANVLAGAISGMPVCHGAGGLTAHHAFGARTGGAPLALGSALLVLAAIAGALRRSRTPRSLEVVAIQDEVAVVVDVEDVRDSVEIAVTEAAVPGVSRSHSAEPARPDRDAPFRADDDVGIERVIARPLPHPGVAAANADLPSRAPGLTPRIAPSSARPITTGPA